MSGVMLHSMRNFGGCHNRNTKAKGLGHARHVWAVRLCGLCELCLAGTKNTAAEPHYKKPTSTYPDLPAKKKVAARLVIGSCGPKRDSAH